MLIWRIRLNTPALTAPGPASCARGSSPSDPANVTNRDPGTSRSRTACSSRSSPPSLMLLPAASASGSMLSAEPRTGSPAANTAIRTGPVSIEAMASIASLLPISAGQPVTRS
jgi:hypothetical protein